VADAYSPNVVRARYNNIVSVPVVRFRVVRAIESDDWRVLTLRVSGLQANGSVQVAQQDRVQRDVRDAAKEIRRGQGKHVERLVASCQSSFNGDYGFQLTSEPWL